MGALDDLMKKTGADKAKGGITTASRRLDTSAKAPSINIPKLGNNDKNKRRARPSVGNLNIPTAPKRASFGVLPKGHNLAADISAYNKQVEKPSFFKRLGKIGTGGLGKFFGGTVNALNTLDNTSVAKRADKRMEDTFSKADTALTERTKQKLKNPNTPAKKRKELQDSLKHIENSSKDRLQRNAHFEEQMDTLGDNLMKFGQASTDRAKQGASKTGKVLIDAADAGVQLAGDIAASYLTGGQVNPLTISAARSGGTTAYQAKAEGKTDDEAALRGGLEFLKIYGLSKLSNASGLAQKHSGKGLLDNFTDKVINGAANKLASTAAGKTAITQLGKLAVSGGGEGLEEMLETAFDPVLDAIAYRDASELSDYKNQEYYSGMLYDGLIGGIVGGVAGGVDVATKTKGIYDSFKSDAPTAPLTPRANKNAPQPLVAPPAMDSGVNALPAQDVAQSATQGATEPLKVKPAKLNIFPENSAGAKITQLPQGTGATSPQFAYQEAVNQQHSTDTAFTEAERQMSGLRHEDNTHQVITDKNAMAQAEQRLAVDFDGEKTDLAKKQDWDKHDTTTAHLILRDLTKTARKSGDYSEVVKWNKTLEKQKSAQGQALQSNRQFVNKPETIVADAAESLFSDKTKKLSKAKKTALMDKISTSADALDGIKQGDTASVVTMIKDISKQRKTNGMFNKEMSKTMSSTLDYIGEQDWGFDFLKEIAAGQVRSIATDYNKAGFWNSVKSIRFSNMLSSFATVFRNLGGNQAFDIGDSVSNNAAVPFDILLSKLSGNRAVAVDASWFSKAKRRGSIDGFLKSFVQVGLDIDVGNVQSKYETTPGRTFKMTGNPIERLLSTVQKWQGYALQSTDEFAKGGTKAEAQRGIDKLKQRGLTDKDALQDRATEIAKERTFQNAGTTAKAVLGIRSAMNEAHLTDSQGGTFGAGDLMVPFGQVPANLGEQAVNATPIGLAKSLTQFVNAIGKAKQGKLTPEQQAHIATNLGRGLTGTAGFAFFTGLALKGVLKVVGSDDKDKDALERSEGQSGTQLNLDALMRWAKGDNVEWQSGDKLVNMGFLEHLNVQMAGGALIAEAYKNDEAVSAKDVTKASVQSVFQTVLELPAISQIRELIDGYRYSKAEDVSGKIVDAGGSYLGGQASSFVVPNIVAGAARGLDPKIRDTHSSDSVVQQTKDDIFSKIPGLRQTLPTKLDPWGNESTIGDNNLLRFINSTVLPAKVNQYQTSGINKELFRLDHVDADVKFPTRKMVSKLSNKGKDFELDIKEQTQFHNKSHKLAYGYMNDAIKDGEYKKMPDSEKAKFLSDMYSLAIDMAKREYFANKGAEYSSDYDTAFKIQEAGMNPATYFHYRKALKKERPEGGTPTQVQLSKAINGLRLPDKDKGTLWEIQNGDPSDKNPFTGLLAQEGLGSDRTIEIMDTFSYIEKGMKAYEKAPNGPSAAHVRAAYFRQWLYNTGYNAAQVAYIEEVFKTWQMIPIDKPSKKATAFVAANPIN